MVPATAWCSAVGAPQTLRPAAPLAAAPSRACAPPPHTRRAAAGDPAPPPPRPTPPRSRGRRRAWARFHLRRLLARAGPRGRVPPQQRPCTLLTLGSPGAAGPTTEALPPAQALCAPLAVTVPLPWPTRVRHRGLSSRPGAVRAPPARAAACATQPPLPQGGRAACTQPRRGTQLRGCPHLLCLPGRRTPALQSACSNCISHTHSTGSPRRHCVRGPPGPALWQHLHASSPPPGSNPPSGPLTPRRRSLTGACPRSSHRRLHCHSVQAPQRATTQQTPARSRAPPTPPPSPTHRRTVPKGTCPDMPSRTPGRAPMHTPLPPSPPFMAAEPLLMANLGQRAPLKPTRHRLAPPGAWHARHAGGGPVAAGAPSGPFSAPLLWRPSRRDKNEQMGRPGAPLPPRRCCQGPPSGGWQGRRHARRFHPRAGVPPLRRARPRQSREGAPPHTAPAGTICRLPARASISAL
jgi:hypothetical protein